MTSAGPWRYRSDVLRELARWGIVPGPETAPAKVYELLKSIYSYEIRRLRADHKEKERVLGPQPLDDYRKGLHALKENYRVLKRPWWQWVEV